MKIVGIVLGFYFKILLRKKVVDVWLIYTKLSLLQIVLISPRVDF